MSLRFKDYASESRAWQGQFVFKPDFQRAPRSPPHFSSRPTERTMSNSGPVLKLNLRRLGLVQKQLRILGQTHPRLAAVRRAV